MRKLASSLALVVASLPLSSCSDKAASAVVLQISSEPHVPGDIDELELQVLRGGAETFSAPHDLRAQVRLPGTLTFYSSTARSCRGRRRTW